jgi:hypothetical protein
MDRVHRVAESDRLRSEIGTLEEKAGLTDAMERAREGRFIPLGALGEKVSPAEYFADEHDHRRAKTRDAYFTVRDIEVRKELIAATRKLEQSIRESFDEDVIAANREAAAAAAKAQNQPWGKAALLGMSLVAVGYWAFGIAGAIGGAVGGFFLGQGLIAQTRNAASAELAQASHDFEQAQKATTEHSLMPEFLSPAEEWSGERDTLIDDESAYANTLRGQRAG